MVCHPYRLLGRAEGVKRSASIASECSLYSAQQDNTSHMTVGLKGQVINSSSLS